MLEPCRRALQAEPDLGVLLPCNVAVRRRGGETHISAIDPERMLSIVDNDELAKVAADVKAGLGAVVEHAARPDTAGSVGASQ